VASSYLDYRGTATSIYLEPIEVRNYLTMNRRAGYKLTDSVTLLLTGQRFNTSRLYQTAAPPVERQLIVSLTARF
jgi:outer membrane receptor for ferrienterochelin and colicins